jgi:hypothetical protein
MMYLESNRYISINSKETYMSLLKEKAIHIKDLQGKLVSFIPYMSEAELKVFSDISKVATLYGATLDEIKYYSYDYRPGLYRAANLQKKYELPGKFINDFQKILEIHTTINTISDLKVRDPFPYKAAPNKGQYRESVLLECGHLTE